MDADARRRRAIALLALLALIWGTNWSLFPIVLREVSVWTFRSGSMVVAAAVLMLIARTRGQSLVLPRRHWAAVTLSSFLSLTYWNIASALAAVMIPSGQAAILGFTMPVWAALISAVLLRERLDARQWLAVVLAACGIGLLAWRSLGAYAQAPLGLVLGLSAAVGWASGTLVLKRSGASEVPALVLSGWSLVIAAVPIVVITAVLLPPPSAWFWPSPLVLAVLAYITLVPMAIGNAAWTAIVGLLPATVAGLSSVAVPMVAMVAGAILHREPLGPAQLLAMLCCGAALVLALRR